MRKPMMILIIISLLVVFIIPFEKTSKDVILLEDESYLSDFSVEEDIVQIHCVISIENKSDTDKTIKIIGDFKDEKDTGLLKEGKLYGVFADTNSDELIISPHSTLKTIRVIFCGEYGGVPQMKDRNLPYIEIRER